MIPAKLVDICVNDKNDYHFKSNQLPFVFDETTVMVVQFEENNPLAATNCTFPNNSECTDFEQRFHVLSKEDIDEHICVTLNDFIAMLAETAQCVGCRRSAEDMLYQAAETNCLAFDPLYVSAKCCVSIDRRYHKKPGLQKSLFCLINNHLNNISSQVELMIRCRRSRRCTVHSLDSQRPRTSTGWLDVWELMSDDCRKEMAVVDTDGLLSTLNDYVQRHKFCAECKARVLTAYDILVGSEDGAQIKGFSAHLYQKINTCSSSNHLHLRCDSDFLSSLIARAEPELFGSQRERHANTVDAAQEEVLTCIGLHVFDRFHRLASRLRTDHQTWNLLIYTCLLALRRKFEVIVEQRRGLAHIDVVCAELLEMDKCKKKQEKKKKKRDRKKAQNICIDSCKTNPKADVSPLTKDLCNCECNERFSSDVESEGSPEATGTHQQVYTHRCTDKDKRCFSTVVADSDESGRGSSPMSVSTPPNRSSFSNGKPSSIAKQQDSKLCKCEENISDNHKSSSFVERTATRPFAQGADQNMPFQNGLCYCEDDVDDGGGGELTEEELREFDSELIRAQREALRRRIREQFNLRLQQLAAGSGCANFVNR